MRYVRPPRMPLWVDLGTGSVVDELAVARAQGGTAHHVTPEQWERLLAEAGKEPWPPGQLPGTGELGDELRQLARTQGQGLGLTAPERALVEARAMDVVTGHFTRGGWAVTDVSAAESFDLLCASRGAGHCMSR